MVLLYKWLFVARMPPIHPTTRTDTGVCNMEFARARNSPGALELAKKFHPAPKKRYEFLEKKNLSNMIS